MILLSQASAFKIPLPDSSVDLCVTSPPYFGLRKYSGAQEFVFGGDAECAHEWGSEIEKKTSDNYNSGFNERWGNSPGEKKQEKSSYGVLQNGNFCQQCGAWRGSYGLEPHLQLYVDHTVEWCREVWRVLKPHASLWLNINDSYAGNGGPGNQWDNKGKKDGFEKFDNPNRGTNIHGLKPKDLMGVPQRVVLALQADGWWWRSTAPWIKRNSMPESTMDRPSTAHEYWYMLTKNKKYYWDMEAVKVGAKPEMRAIRDRRTDKLNNTPGKTISMGLVLSNYQTRSRRSHDMWLESLDNLIAESETYLGHLKHVRANNGMLLDEDGNPAALLYPTKSYPGAHFATYNPDMLDPIIKASTSERGNCPDCGLPWERVVEKGFSAHTGETKSTYSDGTNANRLSLLRQAAREQGEEHSNTQTTIGWRPTCSHYDSAYHIFPRVRSERKRHQQDVLNDWFKRARKRPLEVDICPRCSTTGIDPEDEPEMACYDCIGAGYLEIATKPAIVLDPFSGSGTTMLSARRLGRSSIGLDVSAEYLRLARERLMLTAAKTWESGTQTNPNDGKEPADLSELPLFNSNPAKD